MNNVHYNSPFLKVRHSEILVAIDAKVVGSSGIHESSHETTSYLKVKVEQNWHLKVDREQIVFQSVNSWEDGISATVLPDTLGEGGL